MDKEIENLITEIDDEYGLEENKNREMLDKLYLRRNRIINKIDEYQLKINDLSVLLSVTNDAICDSNGHLFEEWVEIPHKYYSYYSERKCSICGMVEKQYSEGKKRQKTFD